MESQHNIAVLLQPGPQIERNLSNQSENDGTEESFQNFLEDATHKVKETQTGASSKTEQRPNQNHQNNEDPKSAQTRDQKTESLPGTQNSSDGPTREQSSFESDLKTVQDSERSVSENLIKSSPDLSASEEVIVKKLQSMGLDDQSIQAFLSLFNSKNLQIDETSIRSFTGSETDSFQPGAFQFTLTKMQNDGEIELEQGNLERRALDFLRQAGIHDDEAKRVVRQMIQTAAETENSQKKLLKLSDLQPKDTSNSETDSKLLKLSDLQSKDTSNSETDSKLLKLSDLQPKDKPNSATDSAKTTILERDQGLTGPSGRTKFEITSKQFQEDAIKNNKLETTQGKLARQESSDASQVRIQDPVMRTLKSDTAQQNVGTELRIQVAGLNFQNTQDSFTQLHQNLAKAPIETMSQFTAPATENFSNTLRELEINRPILPKGVSERSIVDQVVQKFSIRGNGQNTEIKMRLEPPSLGTVRMNVTTQGETVKTTIFAESHAVKQVIENNLSQLKDSFSDQGLKVESFQVMVGGEPGFKDQQRSQQHLSHSRNAVPEQEDSFNTEQTESSLIQRTFSSNTGGLSVIV